MHRFFHQSSEKKFLLGKCMTFVAFLILNTFFEGMTSKESLARRLTDSQKAYIVEKYANLSCSEGERVLKLREAFGRRFPAVNCTADSLYKLTQKIHNSQRRSHGRTVFSFDDGSKQALRIAYVGLRDLSKNDANMEILQRIFKRSYSDCELSQSRLWNLAIEFDPKETEVKSFLS